MLALQSSTTTVENIDNQFMSLLKTIERYFQNQEYDLLFEWLTELIKKELELKHKQELDYRTFKKDSINILICKVNMFHSRIIEMLIDDIDIAYNDYLEMKASNPEFADQLKLSTISLVNDFVDHLTEHRIINEGIYDQYIDLINQSLQIFNV